MRQSSSFATDNVHISRLPPNIWSARPSSLTRHSYKQTPSGRSSAGQQLLLAVLILEALLRLIGILVLGLQTAAPGSRTSAMDSEFWQHQSQDNHTDADDQ